MRPPCVVTLSELLQARPAMGRAVVQPPVDFFTVRLLLSSLSQFQ
jgi:hypothetical protein